MMSIRKARAMKLTYEIREALRAAAVMAGVRVSQRNASITVGQGLAQQ